MSPKGRRTAVAEEAFLFVNEDFSTLFGDARNAHLGRAKQSHVQRQSFAKRRESKRSGEESASKSPAPSDSGRSRASSGGRLSSPWPFDGAHSPTLSLTGSLRLPAQEASIAQAQPSTLAPRTERQRWLSTRMAGHFQHSLEVSAPRLMQTEELSIDTSYMVYGLGSAGVNDLMFDSGRLLQSRAVPPSPSLVPFFNLRVPLETWAPSLMRYFTSTMIPELFHTDLKAVSINDMRHVENLHADMRSCMSNPAEMYALLAASASHSMGRSGRLDLQAIPAEHNEQVLLLLISKSVEALQHRLASGAVTHRVVVAIQRVACAASYAPDPFMAEPHYRAAMSMMDQLGGLETFKDYEKERLIMYNLHYALQGICAPKIKLTWDPGPFMSNARSEILSSLSTENISTSSRMGTIMMLQADLHPIVAQSILDIVEVQEVLSWLRTQTYRPAEYRWLVQRRLAVMHSLLSLQADAGTLSDDLLRIALICFIVLSGILPWSERLLPGHHVAPTLRKWTADTLGETFAACPETLLWMMVMYGILLRPEVAAGSWPDSTDLSDVAVLVSDVGRRTCRSMDIATESGLRVALQKTLLDDEILNERYLSFCETGLGLG